jgi:hypothetical protein
LKPGAFKLWVKYDDAVCPVTRSDPILNWLLNVSFFSFLLGSQHTPLTAFAAAAAALFVSTRACNRSFSAAAAALISSRRLSLAACTLGGTLGPVRRAAFSAISCRRFASASDGRNPWRYCVCDSDTHRSRWCAVP